MDNSNFIDYVKIYCTSGKGGAGSTHMYRDRINPKGGPDGGDGGRGGHIIIKGNKNLWTLLFFKYKKHIKASHGENGGAKCSSGANGQDKFLEVPLGTIIRDAQTNELLGEITQHDQEIIILEGGKGGWGNTHFKSATNQIPRYAQPGMPAKEISLILELKILSDVGLVGFPNAGKSTLLSVVSAAKPKIADYEFTTLSPNLGIVKYRDFKSFTMSDIPGIIKGASQGKGIGHRFLRHIERNSILLFLISAESCKIREQYDILVNELREFNLELLDKTRVLAISKSDMLDEDLKNEIKKELPEIPYIFISSITNEGIVELKDLLWENINLTNIP
ncbi:GTPase ObgE [Ichthyobacterium seriolicida]|uniref:GTPase Obg n=1 Tax=Ichthyobacterium seriolicida TaxID=242600 RepID=A0A1J1E6I6_9FLAO|nr:GTPase ObgE [Ichthyobacterium seriolicida]BAV94942.1 GTPase CgtA [Ichthyobacterium seriolicida]